MHRHHASPEAVGRALIACLGRTVSLNLPRLGVVYWVRFCTSSASTPEQSVALSRDHVQLSLDLTSEQICYVPLALLWIACCCGRNVGSIRSSSCQRVTRRDCSSCPITAVLRYKNGYVSVGVLCDKLASGHPRIHIWTVLTAPVRWKALHYVGNGEQRRNHESPSLRRRPMNLAKNSATCTMTCHLGLRPMCAPFPGSHLRHVTSVCISGQSPALGFP